MTPQASKLSVRVIDFKAWHKGSLFVFDDGAQHE
jgi:hypothetical protein